MHQQPIKTVIPASRLIGGKFGLESAYTARGAKSISDCLPAGEWHHFVNARSGLMQLIGLLDPPNIWFPSYFCPSMIQSLGVQRNRLSFYPVNERLEVVADELLANVSKADLVVLIDYFGFASAYGWVSNLLAGGVHVLRDSCQSLLSVHTNSEGLYQLFSPRKFFGFPDGGILVNSTSQPLAVGRLAPPPKRWLEESIRAMSQRYEYDCGITDSKAWFDTFRSVENQLPCGKFAMSSFSAKLLKSGIDVLGAATRRRQNFAILASELESWALFKELPPDVVPLGFPVRVRNRDDIQASLFERNIFPPVHWHLDEVCPKVFNQSLQLSKEIMTLPCDQRYGESTMGLLAAAFKNAAGR